MPVSRTQMTACRPSAVAPSSTDPPSGVNLRALSTRLSTAVRSPVSLPFTGSAAAGHVHREIDARLLGPRSEGAADDSDQRNQIETLEMAGGACVKEGKLK